MLKEHPNRCITRFVNSGHNSDLVGAGQVNSSGCRHAIIHTVIGDLRRELVEVPVVIGGGVDALVLRDGCAEAEVCTPHIETIDPVTIKFDEQAIPHIEASNQEDAWHALGLLHATERPWQMEFNRRLAAGKLSEILGKETVEVDQFIRTLGIRRAAEKQYENYPIEYKRHLQAYVDGVNEGLTRLGWALPPEFLILGVKPGHWSPADSVAWSLMMALDLGGNWHKEFLRLELSKTLSTEKIWQVLPPYPGENPPTSVNFAKMYQEMGLFKERGNKKEASRGVSDQFSHTLSDGLMSYLPGGIEGVGSNNWVVSGNKSVSGSPLLANDPHLGLTSPGK